MICSNCKKSGDRARVQFYKGDTKRALLCRWCRAVRTRDKRATALRRARSRSAVAQEVERPAVTREGGGSRPSRGATESTVKPVCTAIALILLCLALAFASCRGFPAEAAEPERPTAWAYETETSLAYTDDPERIPERYRASAREIELGSIFDHPRTTIMETPHERRDTGAPSR